MSYIANAAILPIRSLTSASRLMTGGLIFTSALCVAVDHVLLLV